MGEPNEYAKWERIALTVISVFTAYGAYWLVSQVLWPMFDRLCKAVLQL